MSLPLDGLIIGGACTEHSSRMPWCSAAAHRIDRLGLRCAACGYPIVSFRLEWGPGLFVSGPLAELSLGTTARNIAGARAAAERLLAAVG